MEVTNCGALLSPLAIRGARLKNRIMSTGHDTTLPTAALVNDALIAYQEARARGGAGLIIVQVAGVHETARYTNHILMASSDECIPGYRRLAEAVHAYGTTIFGQLFHPGREITEAQGGLLAVAYAPSEVPNERYHVMPRPLSAPLIREIVSCYGDAARRLYEAGLDGVEIVASHGYLPAQFLSPRVNVRTDIYGGSLENRLRFTREVLADVRAKTSEDFVVGLRISGGEFDQQGITGDEALEAICALEKDIDYIHVVAGTSASSGGAVHIVPPMSIPNGYLAPFSATVKARVSIPVFVTGRINQPQDANAIISSGRADVCGMTRALICDPQMPKKVIERRLEDIRACIACNQACIGHFHKGAPISCIQHPVTGRELIYGNIPRARERKRVMVVGGGPAGMKAAVVAAERGHNVTLFEASGRLGGQALLAQLLPDRMEFGGLVTNLERELAIAQVRVMRNTPVDRSVIEEFAPDAIVVATGARPYHPPLEAGGALRIVDAWDVLAGKANVAGSIVVADWRCDWIGIGMAVHFARNGNRVQLAVNGTMPGQTIPLYVRDQSNAELRRLGVRIIPYARLYGYDDATVYLQDTVNDDPIILDEVDAVVLCTGHRSVSELADSLEDYPGEVHVIGDSLAPRTAEEAIYDGLRVAAAI
ncbi:FAD-dependent oxidoreductase [Mesorhizobium sp. BAC0120]|uniref:oxidoreductase n=1 Tax=Mesorhizobium sp. BAC0120 TaxID=3090670 RepID=UPI00298D3116|nr:FAD-dependent oxidoreductase [Mesorhizobium sp. BAC0120]MDW6024732.1 FAD-dependent oxidoreductase [Mesorhizobium sp. BAC0120]